MVFSFFKKDGKESAGRPPAKTTPAFRATRLGGPKTAGPSSVGRANPGTASPADTGTARAGVSATHPPVRNQESARSVALATAAKIDAIESEMARDFLRARGALPPGASRTDPPASAPAVADTGIPPEAHGASELVSNTAQATVPAGPDEEPDPDAALLGSVNAIEVGSNATSLLDEAAILFANGQPDSAERGLHAALAGDGLGSSAERGWRMLLELQNQRGSRGVHSETATRFRQRFQMAPPAWFDYAVTSAPGASPTPAPVAGTRLPAVDSAQAARSSQENPTASLAAGSGLGGVSANGTAPDGAIPIIVLPEAIDAAIVKPLEELKSLATSHPRLLLDVSSARSVNMVGAELLLRVFHAFRRAPHELQFAGTDALQAALRRAIEPGRRDPSDAAWMLLMEVQRLQNRQADFEETGIQYCITYEVSPPSWEPPPPNIRLCARPPAAIPQTPPVAPAGTPAPADVVEWRGEILADDDPHLNRLTLAARDRKQLTVDCSGLRRMAFSPATTLLGHLFKLQQAGVAIEFRNVNALVAALWQLLGIASVAEVRLRRE